MANTDFDIDVLIAGAGPVGKTIASELARYGIRHRIVDKATGPKDISKAMILHARTQEIQELMGVLPQSIAQGKPMTQLQMHAYGKRIATIHAQVDSPHPHPIIIGQDRTERILERHLESLGGHVDWQTELVEFTQDSDGVTSTLRKSDGSQEIVRSQFIIGSEGSNSVVRKSLQLTFEGGRYEGEQFIQADCKLKWVMPTGMSYLYLTSEGYLMVIEMPDDVVRIFISLPDKPAEVQEALAHEAGAAEDKSNAPSLDEIRTNLERLTGVPAELSDATWLARYRTSHRYTNKFREGRAFVAGDAAHVHVPLGGQGMNTGIQDGFNLAWKLAYVLNGRAHASLLDTYHAERHPVAKALIEGTDKGYTTILHPSQLAQSVVRRLGPFVLSQKLIQTKLMETLEEIKIGYHDSPLSADHGGHGGPHAGDRAPDAIAVRQTDRETVRIHQVIRGVEWTLLIFGGIDPRKDSYESEFEVRRRVNSQFDVLVKCFVIVSDIAPVREDDAVLVDAEHFAHEAFGARGSQVVLIRPDGYIGFRSRTSDSDLLLQYLEGILVKA